MGRQHDAHPLRGSLALALASGVALSLACAGRPEAFEGTLLVDGRPEPIFRCEVEQPLEGVTLWSFDLSDPELDGFDSIGIRSSQGAGHEVLIRGHKGDAITRSDSYLSYVTFGGACVTFSDDPTTESPGQVRFDCAGPPGDAAWRAAQEAEGFEIPDRIEVIGTLSLEGCSQRSRWL